MAFLTGLTHSQWGPSNGARANTTTSPTLDPSVPRFQPHGTELQHYQTQIALSPSSATLESLQMQRLLVDLTLSGNTNYIALDRRNRELYDKVCERRRSDAEFRETVKGDMQTLQGMILEKQGMPGRVVGDDDGISKREIAPESSASRVVSEAFTLPAEMVKSTPREVLTGELELYAANHARSKGAVEKAMAYADALRDELELEREQQGVVDGVSDERVPEQEFSGGFACCDARFDRLADLLEHVSSAHHPPIVEEVQTPTKASHDIGTQTPDAEAPAPESPPWAPLAVRAMYPSKIALPATHTETFSRELIMLVLRGGAHYPPTQWFPGFYTGSPVAPSQAFWLLEAAHEPFLPPVPGAHGAKLTAFFNTTPSSGESEVPGPEKYQNCPVFIRKAERGGGGYVYFGQYSQTRFSDKLDFDTLMTHVPAEVRAHRVAELASVGRPEWVSEALKAHFWPKPTYEGPIPTDSAVASPASGATSSEHSESVRERRVMRGLRLYADELKEWHEDLEVKFQRLDAEALMGALSKADADEEPGLRFWWEYLECVGYHVGLYEMLVEVKYDPELSKPLGLQPERMQGPPRAQKVVAMPVAKEGKKLPAAQSKVLALSPRDLTPAEAAAVAASSSVKLPPHLARKRAANAQQTPTPTPQKAAPAPEPKSPAAPKKSHPQAKKAADPNPKKAADPTPAEPKSPAKPQKPDTTAWGGDLEAAKEFQESATKTKNKAKGGVKPPHLRR